MAFPAFLDTNVLYGATLCDTMLRLAEQGAYRPHWSKDVLGELVEVLVREAGIPRERAERRIAAMQRAFPLAAVEDYDVLVDAMTCDPKDRYVLAAAVQSRCEVVVTFNVRDFPSESTPPHCRERPSGAGGPVDAAAVEHGSVAWQPGSRRDT